MLEERLMEFRRQFQNQQPTIIPDEREEVARILKLKNKPTDHQPYDETDAIMSELRIGQSDRMKQLRRIRLKYLNADPDRVVFE